MKKEIEEIKIKWIVNLLLSTGLTKTPWLKNALVIQEEEGGGTIEKFGKSAGASFHSTEFRSFFNKVLKKRNIVSFSRKDKVGSEGGRKADIYFLNKNKLRKLLKEYDLFKKLEKVFTIIE